eukprot:CAMPEP_0206287598 /NCGR_PEP_ID=MMETSP0106_2-20121207/1189_1 /ASSEMBLY_ACC=CAM_ASM_000206 /TAXON_ID=81532 /ORGANISM="Acanthoeca-like sp., Strain 10tr" /LENGTH=344 /DNA_ID=CAMNT_0053718137 /DNA_START=211 /DNA_END=1246 /DNA_ORIENTATION=-
MSHKFGYCYRPFDDDPHCCTVTDCTSTSTCPRGYVTCGSVMCPTPPPPTFPSPAPVTRAPVARHSGGGGALGMESTTTIIISSVSASVLVCFLVSCLVWHNKRSARANEFGGTQSPQPQRGNHNVHPPPQRDAHATPRCCASTAASQGDSASDDFFLSHTQRNGLATTLATDLHASLQAAGMKVWLDVKMDSRSLEAMRQGVEESACVIAVITGPCTNPDVPDDLPSTNAYFSRPYCISELRWALAAGIPILPVVRSADKGKIGELMSLAPNDLQFLADIDFIALDRSDKDYWNVGIRKIVRAANVTSRGPGFGSTGAFTQPYPGMYSHQAEALQGTMPPFGPI